MISAIIITKNEEDRIETCLRSVKWVDEIIILDNGSSDKTLDIAKKYTDKIFSFDNLDFSSLRNKGVEKSTGDWILYIDSDERVLDPLKKEIEEVVKEDKYSALAISRKNIIFGQEVHYGPFWPDWVIRLLKKEAFETWVGKIHENPKFKGKLGYSKNSFLHLTHRNVDQIVLKSLEWSKIDAQLRYNSKHPKMSALRFLRILFVELFNQGVRKGGFFNRSIGAMDSVLQTFSMFITYIRLWQMQQEKSLDKTYKEIDEDLVKNDFNYTK